MKRKFIGALLCAAMSAAVLAGCASGGVPADDTAADNTKADDKASDDTSSLDGTDSDKTAADDTADSGEDGKTIALAMPTQSAQRWIDDAQNMQKALEAKGYKVVTQFADDDPLKQVSQIEGFIEDKVDCIVITAVNSAELTTVEASADEAGIPIIAYDRLLMDTEAVSFYATFDNKGIGTIIGRTIVEKAGLDSLADGEYKTIEFFMGSPDDNNSLFIYNGLMEVLQPYLDDGTLVCKTGRTSFEDTCILRWSQETAKQWCENYLAGYYTDEDLDICAAAFDGFAYGCKAALTEAGYTVSNWPLISGQDCETMACKNILDGTQTFSISKDTRILAEKCVLMVDAVVNGTEPEINDVEQYNNNVMFVPTYMCTPAMVDKDNLQEIIIDSGYYTKEQIDSAQ